MGKDAQRDRRREEAMGLRGTGLRTRDVQELDDEARSRFGLGIGVLVQEEDRARLLVASLERQRVAWGQVERRMQRWAALRAARAALALWSDRMRVVTSAVAGRAPTGRVESARRAR